MLTVVAGITLVQIIELAVLLLVILPGILTIPIVIAVVKTYLEWNENQELRRARRR